MVVDEFRAMDFDVEYVEDEDDDDDDEDDDYSDDSDDFKEGEGKGNRNVIPADLAYRFDRAIGIPNAHMDADVYARHRKCTHLINAHRMLITDKEASTSDLARIRADPTVLDDG